MPKSGMGVDPQWSRSNREGADAIETPEADGRRAANVRKRLDILVLRADDVLAIPQN